MPHQLYMSDSEPVDFDKILRTVNKIILQSTFFRYLGNAHTPSCNKKL